MEELKNTVTAMGVDCTKLSDEQVRNVAKALGLPTIREVEIKEHNGAMYVVTEGYSVPHKNAPGKTQTARGLFLRVEAIPQALADLKAAMGLVNREE